MWKFIDPTPNDQLVFKWILDHLQVQQLGSIAFQIVEDALFVPSDPTKGQITVAENIQIVVTNTMNRKTQEFDYKLTMAHPDEALLEISQWLVVPISHFEYYHSNAPVEAETTKPYVGPPDKDGNYKCTTLDTYQVGQTFKDETGTYLKIETGGWAFVKYYGWKKVE